MRLQVPQVIRWYYKNVLWHENPKEKKIYLTFDDGPVPEVTPKVLEILHTYRAKATFFCVGDNVRKHPETYRQVLNEGHRTGNHTFNHIKGFDCPPEKYVENVKKASGCIDSKLFRPPHGQISQKLIGRLSPLYKIVMWDIITYDFDQKNSPENIMKLIRKKSKNGSIVVFHDSLKAKKNLLETLPLALDYWTTKGFQVVSLEE
ncbi:MAG: polysaccharide deacetylase family protein [Paludibacteraceae bacterium]